MPKWRKKCCTQFIYNKKKCLEQLLMREREIMEVICTYNTGWKKTHSEKKIFSHLSACL